MHSLDNELMSLALGSGSANEMLRAGRSTPSCGASFALRMTFSALVALIPVVAEPSAAAIFAYVATASVGALFMSTT